ncbi:ATP-binding protein [Candidatus Avelusimicrobium alvi]|uniref:ATP-binding protein n=1 Tax=Candidatus Avelusimicrobium alvi TaxID=3416221 RepID=UPI003D1067C9
MLTKIKNILSELHGISFLQPIFEAINNSLEAKATDIKIHIKTVPWLFNAPEDTKNYKAIDSIAITDNGNGFNSENILSFCEYLSDYKAKIGCKGVGRFTWLKTFQKIEIQSKIQDSQGYNTISFVFDESFDNTTPQQLEESRVFTPAPLYQNETTINFVGIRENYSRDTDRIISLEDFARKIKIHLLPNLVLMKQSGRKFAINILIDDETMGETISSDNIPIPETTSFSIEKEISGNTIKTDFKLSYLFLNDTKSQNMHFYCANNRTVMSFGNIQEEKVSFIAPGTDSSIFLLQSTYFDNLCNNERNAFKYICPKETSLCAVLSWNDINSQLRKIISTVSQKKYPELADKNKNIIENLVENNPHLAGYLRKNNNIIGATSPDSLLKKAKKEFENDKIKAQTQFTKALKNAKVNSPAFKEAVEKVEHIAALDLAQYIHFRQNIINALKQTHNENSAQEDILHHLFAKKHQEITNASHLDSNIWLLDDKFMTYHYMASDITMKKIGEFWSKDIEQEDKLKRPDLFVTFSKPETENEVDCTIIEFKACGASNNEKRKAISEIWDNLGAVRDNFSNIRNIWGYIITSIDENLVKALKRNNFKPLFSHGENNLFYSFNGELNIHCYALSTDAIVKDANARNKVFLDIIKKES